MNRKMELLLISEGLKSEVKRNVSLIRFFSGTIEEVTDNKLLITRMKAIEGAINVIKSLIKDYEQLVIEAETYKEVE